MGVLRFPILLLWGLILAVCVVAEDNGVGRTPVMGVSGYNALMQGSGKCDKAGASGYNETTFLQWMDVLVNTGLAEAGYTLVSADDCWIADTRDSKGRLQADPVRFPRGMAFLADQAHSRGLKLGLYASAGKLTCRNFPGSDGHEKLDADTFVEWGADFVKLDACFEPSSGLWEGQYDKWSAALNMSGKAMIFSCSWPAYYEFCLAKPPGGNVSNCGDSPWPGIANICNMWRYGNDLDPAWTRGGSGIMDIINHAAAGGFADKAPIGPGQFNDPDYLVVGCPTDAPCEPNYPVGPRPLSDTEQRTQMSMWAILAAPLIIGSDIRELSATAFDTLTNADVLRISQDPAGHQGTRVTTAGDAAPQVWVRRLTPASGESTAIAIAMLNAGEDAVRMSATFAQLGLPASAPSADIKDVWRGNSTTVNNAKVDSGTSVPPHGTVLLRVSLPANGAA